MPLILPQEVALQNYALASKAMRFSMWGKVARLLTGRREPREGQHGPVSPTTITTSWAYEWKRWFCVACGVHDGDSNGFSGVLYHIGRIAC